MNKTHIIIGTSAAGIGVLNKLRALDPQSTIICISDEKEFPYNKCFLADFCAGSKSLEAVRTKNEQFFKDNRIDLRLGLKVVAIKRDEKKIELSGGTHLAYDTLFLGLGSGPVKPPITCSFNKQFLLNDREVDTRSLGLFTFHTLVDITNILNYLKKESSSNVIIVGAGLSGLECADALLNLGLNISVIDSHDQVLARQVDRQGSALIEQCMKQKNVSLIKNDRIKEIVGAEKVSSVTLESGNELKANAVIFATGLHPRTQLAQQAGIELSNGYIVTNEFLQTNDPSIFAGGDCILVKDQLTGDYVPSCTWSDAMLQGLIAAHGISGIQRSYPGTTIITSSTFFGIQFVTCGPVTKSGEYQEVITTGGDYYHKFLVHDEYLKGFLLVGHVNDAPRLKKLILTRQKMSF